MKTPFISIITPLYNREWCVADCLESIGLGTAAAELLIVDDGSRDDSVRKVRETVDRLKLANHVTLIEQKNAGPSAARNRAAEAARGVWLVFLDSDDLWFPWTLQTLSDVLSATVPDVSLAFARGVNFAEVGELAIVGRSDPQVQSHVGFLEAVARNRQFRFGACNAAMRRSEFFRLGGFSRDLRCSEDTDLFLRASCAVVTISEPILVGLRRSGHESLTGNPQDVIAGFEWMFRQDAVGRYPGQSADIRGFLAMSCAYAIRTAFAAGQVGKAYALYLRNMGLLSDRRTRGHLMRLPLTPLLHLVRPAAYPFRMPR